MNQSETRYTMLCLYNRLICYDYLVLITWLNFKTDKQSCRLIRLYCKYINTRHMIFQNEQILIFLNELNRTNLYKSSFIYVKIRLIRASIFIEIQRKYEIGRLIYI